MFDFLLRNGLSKKQRIILLRILDEKDLLIASASDERYQKGLQDGILLMVQVYQPAE